MTTDGGGWTFYYVNSGLPTTNVSDNNTCKDKNLMLFTPVSQSHFNSGRDYVKNILGKPKDPKVLGPLGLYSTSAGDIPGERDGYCENPLNTYDANGIRSHPNCQNWTSLNGNVFWISNIADIEPNGDYIAGDWLYFENMNSDWYLIDYNDYPGGDWNGINNTFLSYLCMSKHDKTN